MKATLILLLFHLWAHAEGSPQDVKNKIQNDLLTLKSQNLAELFKRWENEHQALAIPALRHLAQDQTLQDTARFTAILGLAKLAGTSIAPELIAFFNERSWMIRSAALQATRALKTQDLMAQVTLLLNDPALVIRNEALDVLLEFKDLKSTPKLTEHIKQTVLDPRNYHQGKPLWVPQKSLKLLMQIASLKEQQSVLKNLFLKRKTLFSKDVYFLESVVQHLGQTLNLNFKKTASLPEKIKKIEATLL